MKILVIQPNCRRYREKLFDELAKAVKGLDLLHFGEKKFPKGHRVRECEAEKVNLFNFHWIKGLYRLVKTYDIVIVVYDPHWLNAFFLSLFFENKIIYWGHGLGKSKAINVLRKLVGSKARSILTYDDKGKEDIVGLGIDRRKVFVANNTQHVSNSENLSSKEKNCFLFVGRLQDRKKVEDLIEAFAQVKEQLPANTRIVIVGDGEHQKKLKNKANSLKVDEWVDFVKGTTNDEILKEYFSKAYAYVSPGHVGLGVLHSFAYGVPVITYRGDHHAPEYSNIEDDYTGYVVDSSIKSLAQSLVKLTSNNKYIRMGDKAFQHYIDNRQVSQMVKAFLSAIEVSSVKEVRVTI